MASCTPDITFLDLGQSGYGTIPKDSIKFISAIANYDVVSMGCGLSQIGGVEDFVLSFIKKNKNSYTPIIIDATSRNMVRAIFPHTPPKLIPKANPGFSTK